MSGSGTSKAAADRSGVRSILYDLNPAPAHGKGGWNALKDDVEDSADLVFFHESACALISPYHNIIQYSGNMWGKPHPDDLSRCEDYNDFLEKLNLALPVLAEFPFQDGGGPPDHLLIHRAASCFLICSFHSCGCASFP